MRIQFALASVGLALGCCLNARGQDLATAPDVTRGFQVGDSMPFHVVDFVAGARESGRGCPSVMISNAQTRGVEIWSRSADDAPFNLAGALERKLPDDMKPRAFLILFDETGKDSLQTQADKHGLKKFHVTVPLDSTKRSFRTADRSNDSRLIVFLLDRKVIKRTWSFKQGDMSDDVLQKLISETEAFLSGQE